MAKLSRTSKCFLKLLCGLLMVLLAFVSLCSCRTSKELPVTVIEVVKHDTINKELLRVDSVVLRDSVYEYIYVNGDTIVREKTKFIEKWQYKLQLDSIYIHVCDTTEVPVKVKVEKSLTPWQLAKVRFGGYAIATCFGMLAFVIYVLYRFFKKRRNLGL